MKRKIGTVVDDVLYNDVKVLATQERRRIAEVVELALNDYVQRAKARRSERVGLDRLLEDDPLTSGFDTFVANSPYRP